MNGTPYSPLPRGLAAELGELLVEGVGWPIDRGSLAALLDMGLSPGQIAGFFTVTPEEVLELLHKEGIASGGVDDESFPMRSSWRGAGIRKPCRRAKMGPDLRFG
jgi:hypothetical protein